MDGAFLISALTANRMLLGIFFFCSGFNKLFNEGRACRLRETFVQLKIPLVDFNVIFVPAVYMAAGLGMIAGLFTPLSALGLMVPMVVAMSTDAIHRVHEMQPINFLDRCACILYLPEALYISMLAVAMFAGSGPLGLDPYFWAYVQSFFPTSCVWNGGSPTLTL